LLQRNESLDVVVYCPPQRAEERLRQWREAFSPLTHVKADFDRMVLAHDLTGGAIINIIRKVSLAVCPRGLQSTDDGDQ
jgi:hypothetical protein